MYKRQLQAQRNKASKEIGALMGQGKKEEAEAKKQEKKENFMMGMTITFSILLAVLLFMVVPYGATSFLKRFGLSKTMFAVCEGIIKLAVFLLYIWGISKMQDIKRVFMYHGAEHKTIFCYEYGLDLTVENVMKQRRFHPRCGTSFIIIILILGIFVGCFIPFTNPFIRTLTKVLCIPLVVGLGYELIKVCGRHDNIITRIISAPGMWMQHLTTKEPDPDMAEVAIKAMQYVIPENGEDRIG